MSTNRKQSVEISGEVGMRFGLSVFLLLLLTTNVEAEELRVCDMHFVSNKLTVANLRLNGWKVVETNGQKVVLENDGRRIAFPASNAPSSTLFCRIVSLDRRVWQTSSDGGTIKTEDGEFVVHIEGAETVALVSKATGKRKVLPFLSSEERASLQPRKTQEP